jgi:hypothetical protein
MLLATPRGQEAVMQQDRDLLVDETRTFPGLRRILHPAVDARLYPTEQSLNQYTTGRRV